MGLLSIPPHVQRHRVRPWPRQSRRPWIRRDDVTGTAALLAIIPSLPRATLSRLTTQLIDHLDVLDGPEDDEDDDPAGDAVDDSGEADDSRPDGITLDRPLYGLDQALGPVNEREVHRAYQLALREDRQ